MLIFKLVRKLAATIMLSGCIILACGCMSKTPLHMSVKSKIPESSMENSSRENTAREISDSANWEAERLNNCQKELSILKGVSPKKYTVYKRTFDGLMGGAAQYAGLRKAVNANIQETVDALYRFKVNRLCAEISQGALEALVERGEQFK
ncbi:MULTISPECIES: hypothetical protein [Enterobacter cloacae complex]|uniref:hypothetical protein n=1 Tax=Enterobacter cloacae complex TaxID=354276 RepID=UPI00307607A6